MNFGCLCRPRQLFVLPHACYGGLFYLCMQFTLHIQDSSTHPFILNRAEPKALIFVNSTLLTNCMSSVFSYASFIVVIAMIIVLLFLVAKWLSIIFAVLLNKMLFLHSRHNVSALLMHELINILRLSFLSLLPFGKISFLLIFFPAT